MQMKKWMIGWTVVLTVTATGALAGNSVIPNPDSDANVMGPKPGTSRGPCIVDGKVLQDCAPRNWQRDAVTGTSNGNANPQRIAPARKNGSTIIPLNN
jgi:hypothetical protein